MPTTTTLQNGQTFSSTALIPDAVQVAFQLLCTQLLGITANLQLPCDLLNGSNQIVTPLVVVNLEVGNKVTGTGIPDGTTITALAGQGKSLIITLSNNAIQSGNFNIAFFDIASDTRVRIAWQTQGEPAFQVDEDVLYVMATENPSDYDVRDEIYSNNDDGTVTKTRIYSRLWNLFFRARGPNSYDSIRLIRSMLLEDYAHDTLAALKLYLVPSMGTPVRAPELFNNQWWEQVDFNAAFFEQVTETIIIPTVTSVEVFGETNGGKAFDVIVSP